MDGEVFARFLVLLTISISAIYAVFITLAAILLIVFPNGVL